MQNITTSIGIRYSPRNEKNIDELINKVDVLYKNKRPYKNKVIYDDI